MSYSCENSKTKQNKKYEFANELNEPRAGEYNTISLQYSMNSLAVRMETKKAQAVLALTYQLSALSILQRVVT